MQNCCVFVLTAVSPYFIFFSQNILHFTRNAFEKVLKIYTWMPDWALKSLGMQTEFTALSSCLTLPKATSSAFSLRNTS